MWKSIALLASTASAGRFSFGGCKGVKTDVITQNKKHNNMEDTYIQVAEANVDIFGNEIVGWVPSCSRHELLQVEDYPIFDWVHQV